MSRNINQNYHPKAVEFITGYHSTTVSEVAQAAESNTVLVVGMAQNPVVKKARKRLEQENIPFKYLEYGSYFSEWKPRLMIKIWSGWPTFPQIFVHGRLIGGAAELEALIESGEMQALLNTGE